MELFLAVLVLLLLLAFSQVIQRLVPFVPLPIVQIAMGAAVVLFPWHFHVELEPELFFLLFIAPLLFNDGRRTPRDELWKLRTPILLLAVGLVFVTVLVGGCFVHALIPTIPLAASFGLAAILSPTDAVAVSAIAAKVHLPKKIHRLLEGESLMNDASGLVAFKFAVAAAVTGAFSLWNAAWSFLLIAIGGILVGAVLAIFIIWVRMSLRRFGNEDTSVHMLIQILTPFILFYVAEHVGLSGILAAVSGGVMMAIEQDRSGFTTIEQKLVSEITWSVILFIMNGLVFVLLGVQIPKIAGTIFQNVSYDNLKVIGYVLLLNALLLALRFVWITIYSQLAGSFFRSEDDKENASWKSLWLTSLSGVRGAITLAGAFTIPLTLGNGSPFPERDLILFLCAGVILVSLTQASIALPLLADRGTGASEESLARGAEFKAQIESIKAANLAVRQAIDGSNNQAAAVVIANNDQRLTDIKRSKYDNLSKKARHEELRLRQLGIAEERKCVQLLREKGDIKPEEAAVLQNIYNRIEMVYSNRLHIFYLLLYAVVNKVIATFLPKRRSPYANLNKEDRKKFILLRITTAKYAIDAIRTDKSCSGSTVSRVSAHYRHMVNMLNNQLSDPNDDDFTEEQVQALEMLSIQAERDALQQQYQQGTIGRKQLSKLQFQISMHEAEVMDNSWKGLLEG